MSHLVEHNDPFSHWEGYSGASGRWRQVLRIEELTI